MDKSKLILPTNQNYVNHKSLNVASMLAAVEIMSEKGAVTSITMIKNQAISDEI